MPANELDVRQPRKPHKHLKLSDTPPVARHGHLELAPETLENSVQQEI